MKLKFYLRNLLATLVLVLIAGSAWAQSRRVTGIVYDTDGKPPMVGATILVKNTTNGVISGIDGSYTIEVPGDDATLIFQSLGYAGDYGRPPHTPRRNAQGGFAED